MTLGGYYLEFPASYALIATFTLIFFAGLNDTNLAYKGMLSTYNIKHKKELYRLFSSGFIHGFFLGLVEPGVGVPAENEVHDHLHPDRRAGDG